MVRSGNLFLSLLWAFSFLVGLGGAVFMIFLAFQEFLQYDVITTTKIKKENALILPAITFCAENTESSFNKYIARDMLLDCTVLESTLGDLTKCDFTDLSLYDHYYLTELKCVQFTVNLCWIARVNKQKVALLDIKHSLISRAFLLNVSTYKACYISKFCQF